jgi:hypothetical protein
MVANNLSTLCALVSFAGLVESAALALDPILPDLIAQPKQISGSWSAQSGRIKHVITFKEDFTFGGKMFDGDVVADEYAGTWYLSQTVGGSILSYTYTQSKVVKPGTKDQDKLVGFTGDTFSVLTAGNKVREYQRLPKNKTK